MWATGKRAWALCQICGRRFTHPQLRKNDQGLMVCEADYDGAFGLSNHPQNGPFPVSPDPIALPYVLPDSYFNNPAVGADNTISVTITDTTANVDLHQLAQNTTWNGDPSRQFIFVFTTAASATDVDTGIWPTMAVLPLVYNYGNIVSFTAETFLLIDNYGTVSDVSGTSFIQWINRGTIV